MRLQKTSSQTWPEKLRSQRRSFTWCHGADEFPWIFPWNPNFDHGKSPFFIGKSWWHRKVTPLITIQSPWKFTNPTHHELSQSILRILRDARGCVVNSCPPRSTTTTACAPSSRCWSRQGTWSVPRYIQSMDQSWASQTQKIDGWINPYIFSI